jgi:MYXO-CTERM domain-containing protein
MDKRMRKRIALAAGAVSLLASKEAVASSFVPPQELVNVELNSSHKVQDVGFLYYDAIAEDFAPADEVKFKFTTTTKDKVETYLTYELTDVDGSNLDSLNFLVIGEYTNDNGNPLGVFVGMDNNVASQDVNNQLTFDAAFNIAETTVESALEQDALLSVLGQDFVKNAVGATDMKFGTPGSIVDFSTASIDGTVTVTQATPAPPSLLTMLTGLTGLLAMFGIRRRRCSTRG